MMKGQLRKPPPKIVETGQTEKVLQSPAHPYTQELLRAVPRLASTLTAPGSPDQGARVI